MAKLWIALVLLLAVQSKIARGDDDVMDDLDDDTPPGVIDDENHETTPTTFEPENFETPDHPDDAHFAEFFHKPVSDDDLHTIGWIKSQAKKDGLVDETAKYDGKFSVTSPQEGSLKNDYCLVAESKARHHAICAKLGKPFSFKKGTPFIVQYDVTFQIPLECGGAYIKLLDEKFVDLVNFNDKTPYSIMFGPDKCGLESKIHFIIRFKNPISKTIHEHHAKKSDKAIDTYFTDKKSHLYRLVLNPDDSYEISVDHVKIMSGNLMHSMTPAIVPAKEIEDPNDKKPADWDEREKIADPDAKKPGDWDENAPEKIVDTNAQMPSDWLVDEPEFLPNETAQIPSDWDEEMDGKWEAPLIKNPKCEKISGCGKWSPPMIKNPDFKGKWKAPMISNLKYQGKWSPKKIANPDYFEVDSAFSSLETIGAVGLELWTMTENIAFDNFLITDQLELADQYAQKTWGMKNLAESRRASKGSIFSTLIETANDKPWLWAVYLLVVLIPIILVTIFCFGGSKDTKGQAKKTDESTPDDPTGKESQDEEMSEDQEEMEKKLSSEKNGDMKKKSDLSRKSKSKKSASPVKMGKADLEENSDNEMSGSGSSGSKKEGSSGRSPRRRGARKAD